jgi:hypothetical protein
MLQFEKKIWIIERSADEAKLGGVEAGWAHINMMRSKRGRVKRMKGESGTGYSPTFCPIVRICRGASSVYAPVMRKG